MVVAAILIAPATAVAQQVFPKGDGAWATEEIALAGQATSVSALRIMAAAELRGRLTITTHESDRLEVTYIKRAKTASRSDAINYIDLLAIALDFLPKEARLELRAPNPSPWAKRGDDASMDVAVRVPVKWKIAVEATYYDVTAEGPFSAVVIKPSLGRLSVSKVDGVVDLATANRRVDIEDVTGRISVTTSNAMLAGHGIVSLTEPARFRNEAGEVDISDVRGAVNITNEYGRISVTAFDPAGAASLIRGGQAPITIELGQVSAGLVVSNRNEDIDIAVPSGLSAMLHLAVDDNGLIEATGFPFTTDLVQPTRLTLIAGGGEVDISGKIRGEGNIYVRGLREE
jgi:hypothetical protein